MPSFFLFFRLCNNQPFLDGGKNESTMLTAAEKRSAAREHNYFKAQSVHTSRDFSFSNRWYSPRTLLEVELLTFLEVVNRFQTLLQSVSVGNSFSHLIGVSLLSDYSRLSGLSAAQIQVEHAEFKADNLHTDQKGRKSTLI